MSKKCTKCQEEKSLSEFYSHKNSKDGLSWRCKDCIKKHTNTFRQENPDLIKSKKRLYRATYKEVIAERKREYHQKNKDKIIERVNVWRANNIDRDKANRRRCESRRRARKLKVKENYTNQDEKFTLDLFKHQCVNCGATDNLQIDHHYPLSKGNALSRENAVVLCLSCNASKGAKVPKDFYDNDTLSYIEEKLSPASPKGGAGY